MIEVKPIYRGPICMWEVQDGSLDVVVLRAEDWEKIDEEKHPERFLEQKGVMPSESGQNTRPDQSNSAVTGASPSGANETGQKWERGTVLVNEENPYGWRLDKFLANSFWVATSMSTGESFALKFPNNEWRVHRRPHEFRVGDWADCVADDEFNGDIFQVKMVSDNQRFICAVSDGSKAGYPAEDCRHAPPLKPDLECETDESNMELQTPGVAAACKLAEKTKERFSGPHWTWMEEWLEESKHSTVPVILEQVYSYQRLLDLRDDNRDLRERIERLEKEKRNE